MSGHVLVDDFSDGQHILEDLRTLLRERFGIDHTTVQLESDRSPLIRISPGSDHKTIGSLDSVSPPRTRTKQVKEE